MGTFFHVNRRTVPPFALCIVLSLFVSCLRHFPQKGKPPAPRWHRIAGNQSPSQSKTRTAGDTRLGRNRVRIPVTGHLEEANRDGGGVWDWDIGNGNAILLEADAGDIRVIDHMDHLVGVR
jgi:hypothetical protein